jgi:hypothetical protein
MKLDRYFWVEFGKSWLFIAFPVVLGSLLVWIWNTFGWTAFLVGFVVILVGISANVARIAANDKRNRSTKT